jgi:hypothetical protein
MQLSTPLEMVEDHLLTRVARKHPLGFAGACRAATVRERTRMHLPRNMSPTRVVYSS